MCVIVHLPPSLPFFLSLCLSLKNTHTHTQRRSVLISVYVHSPHNFESVRHEFCGFLSRHGGLFNAYFCRLGGAVWIGEAEMNSCLFEMVCGLCHIFMKDWGQTHSSHLTNFFTHALVILLNYYKCNHQTMIGKGIKHITFSQCSALTPHLDNESVQLQQHRE